VNDVSRKTAKVSAVKPVAVNTKRRKRGRRKKSQSTSAIFVKQIIIAWK
jgi:hypothetical protein